MPTHKSNSNNLETHKCQEKAAGEDLVEAEEQFLDPEG